MSSALTVKEVAELLAVNERTVYRLANTGQLPGFKVGGTWRFLKEDIEAWIARQKQRLHDQADSGLSNAGEDGDDA